MDEQFTHAIEAIAHIIEARGGDREDYRLDEIARVAFRQKMDTEGWLWWIDADGLSQAITDGYRHGETSL